MHSGDSNPVRTNEYADNIAIVHLYDVTVMHASVKRNKTTIVSKLQLNLAAWIHTNCVVAYSYIAIAIHMQLWFTNQSLSKSQKITAAITDISRRLYIPIPLITLAPLVLSVVGTVLKSGVVTLGMLGVVTLGMVGVPISISPQASSNVCRYASAACNVYVYVQANHTYNYLAYVQAHAQCPCIAI